MVDLGGCSSFHDHKKGRSMVALKKDLVMTDPRRCSKCGADVEEMEDRSDLGIKRARVCEGCGLLEFFCECEQA